MRLGDLLVVVPLISAVKLGLLESRLLATEFNVLSTICYLLK